MNASEPTLYNLAVGRCWELPQVHESLLQRVLVSTARDRHAGVRATSGYIRRAVDLNKCEPTDLCPGHTADRVESCGVSRVEDCTRRFVKCART